MGLKFILILGVILFFNLLLWIFAIPRYVNRTISRFQNDLVNRHYDEVETMYRRMRGWRHDYHNHIQTLKAHMDLAQYEQASLYLDSLEEDLANVDTVLKTGNRMVDAVLNSKLALIQERHIRTDATALVPEDIPISGIDLSVLIGNLLDNAMEACMHLPEQDRFIRIYIDIVKKQFYLSVTNSMVNKSRKRNNPDPAGKRKEVPYLSEKQGNHGFGLLRIDSIVQKYNGYLNRQTEEGVFVTEVMLPLV